MGAHAQFIDGRRGKLFTLLRRPPRVPDPQCVIFVPPFAEEMNKTRKLLTEVAIELAAQGVASLSVDLYGTGDSEGEFREADWEVWKGDVIRSATWASEQGMRVTGILAVRLGCALAAEAAAGFAEPVVRTMFWQPVLDGERYVTQFLRMRVAASMMRDRKESVADLRAQIEGGSDLEVAGYELSRNLVRQLDKVRLADGLHEKLGKLYWVEIVREADAPLPAPAVKAIERARTVISDVNQIRTVGEPFWASTEIVTNAELVRQTLAAFLEST